MATCFVAMISAFTEFTSCKIWPASFKGKAGRIIHYLSYAISLPYALSYATGRISHTLPSLLMNS